MEKQLTCQVNANWESGRRGFVTTPGTEQGIHFSSPPEFKGDPGFWTPEDLLLGAVASCFVVTFYALAERARLEFGTLALSAEGTLSTFEGRLSFQQIVLRPTVTILRNEDRERAYGLLEKTERGCLIARTLNCRVWMEPSVQTAEKVLVR